MMIKEPVQMEVLRSRDRIGGTIITELFQQVDHTYVAYSNYAKDEETLGVCESKERDEAVRLSKKKLRKEWRLGK